MKVNNSAASQIIKAYSSNAAGTVNTGKYDGGTAASLQDKVDMSDNATLFKEINDNIPGEPKLRSEKVEEVRSSIEAGTYTSDFSAIAEKLLNPNPAARL